ncbi:MAG: DUF5642 family protein [Actinophytocola sp.]|uniref:DUF5642 family protein n=1 Tax=Actinophytocola sp. TaxID=1872138 RepID=UPI003C71DD7B
MTTDDFGIEPRGKRRVAWWVTALAIIVAVLVVTFLRDAGPGEQTGALLTADDFGAGYEVEVMTGEQLGQANSGTDLPEGIEPAECAELLAARPAPTGADTASGVAASGDGAAYLELLMPADGVTAWDTDRLGEVVDTCRTTTYDDGDSTGTVEFGHLPAPVADGFGLTARISSGDGVVTLGVAVSRVGEHVVVLTGVATGDLDEREFTRLVAAANDRVSAQV